MVIGIAWLGVYGFVVADTEDRDHCDEDGDDEYAKTCVLG